MDNIKDLKIDYDNENGERVTKEYDTIMDFIDEMESDSFDIPMMDYNNVNAKFFENPLQTYHFATIEYLYNHCKEIVK